MCSNMLLTKERKEEGLHVYCGEEKKDVGVKKEKQKIEGEEMEKGWEEDEEYRRIDFEMG